jgi:hypothetical protein
MSGEVGDARKRQVGLTQDDELDLAHEADIERGYDLPRTERAARATQLADSALRDQALISYGRKQGLAEVRVKVAELHRPVRSSEMNEAGWRSVTTCRECNHRGWPCPTAVAAGIEAGS